MSLLSAVLQEVDKACIDEFKKYRDELLPFIRDLTERIQLLSWALQQNFVDTYVNFTPTKSLEQLNYKNRKVSIVTNYEELVCKMNSLREKYQHEQFCEEFDNYVDKMDKSFGIFKDLCVVVEGKKVLEQANHEFVRFNYNDAMLTVMELQKELKSIKLDSSLAKPLSNLNAQAENQFSMYAANLSIEWEDVFTWSEDRSVHYLTYSLSVQQSDPLLIQRVLKTLYLTERMNAELGLFSHFFIDKLLHSIIRHNCHIFTDDHIGAVVFNIKIDLNDTKKPNYQTIFNNLTAVFEFLQSTIGSHFENDKSFIEVFAESIRSKFFNKIIQDCIRNNLPSCNSSYEHYKAIVVELDLFNKFLIDLKFVKASDSPLSKYINDTECVLYNKKCDKLLSDVRTFLSQSLSYGTLTVGNSAHIPNDSVLDLTDKEEAWDLNKPLFLPKCVISQNVQKIMMLIVDHLEESVKLPEKYRRQLVMYIKDIAVMYQCIVPQKFKVNLECCPLDIALFFNNCFYLAHGLLGPPWKNTLPAELADQLINILLESIQSLRVLGLEKMSLYLQHQKNLITLSIETPEPSPWTQETYDQFDIAVNTTMNLLQDLKTSWYNVLPARMYEMAVCTLVQALCQSILQRIFCDSRPISEELVYMLAVRFEDIVTDVTSLFMEPIEFENKISIWTKFIKLPQLLKAQLLETAKLWTSDKDLANSYSCEEIRHVVKMRFPDDKYRLKILKEIQ